MKKPLTDVERCWQIARNEAEAYQHQMNRARSDDHFRRCKAGRDAADRIARKIRQLSRRRSTPVRA